MDCLRFAVIRKLVAVGSRAVCCLRTQECALFNGIVMMMVLVDEGNGLIGAGTEIFC